MQPVRRHTAVNVRLGGIGQHHIRLILLEQPAVMPQELGVGKHIGAAPVDLRVIVKIFNSFHELKFLAVRAGNQHLIVMRQQRLDQLLAEAINIVVIVCKKRH